MRRSMFAVVSVAVVTISTSLVVTSASGTASAKAKPGITCASMTASDISGMSSTLPFFNGTVSKCSGNTGTSGAISFCFPVPDLPGCVSENATITWANADRTAFSFGFTKTLSHPKGCPSGAEESRVSGNVLSDTTGSAVVGGKVKSKWCFSGTVTAETITLPAGGKLKIP